MVIFNDHLYCRTDESVVERHDVLLAEALATFSHASGGVERCASAANFGRRLQICYAALHEQEIKSQHNQQHAIDAEHDGRRRK